MSVVCFNVFEMVYHLIFSIAFCILVCNYISLVLTADQCKTSADCKQGSFRKTCCGGIYNPERSCTYSSCLYSHCSSDDDCSDPSALCCRSNKCVKDGCSGCTEDSDCYITHVCCKKTFPLDQTVCGSNCMNQTCNSNNDCAEYGECCRLNKCVDTGCYDKCQTNSNCHLGEYCCKKATYWYPQRDAGCSKSCVGEICSTDEDCGNPNECCISNKCVDQGCSGCTANSNCSTEHYCCKKRYWYELSECSAHCIGKSCSTIEDCGAPNECCISNKCARVDQGCPGCTTNSNCSIGHYCCKKRDWYELSECSAHCIGKSCSTSEDCGGPGETCDSDYRCAKSKNSYPRWLITVIMSSVIFLIAVGVVVICFFKRRRSRNAIQANRATIPLENTQNQSREIQNPGTTIPTQYHGTGLQNQPLQNDNVAPHNPSHRLQGNGTQTSQYQGPIDQNPSLHQRNKNPGFYNPSENHHHQGNRASYRTPYEENVFQNPLYNRTYHHEPPNAAAHGTQQQNPQFYQENILPPPYNPHYPNIHH
ncbi:Hypothetical predicted protein [Paramuricea clavata]|uniref:Uncharacterized protein n=1 Tax=Paramuricea clavata TaxID=317549 RepID=A0A6S7GZ82_PARCT|nr:Hypothetical predicted protein [Paramuricea clavata]